jgi:hypothetical protein
MNDKIKNNAYKKLAEFETHCQNIVHCVSVLNGPNSVITSLSAKILQNCDYDSITTSIKSVNELTVI